MTKKITGAVDAAPYPKAPSIWIAFPQPGDWRRVFAPVLDRTKVRDAHWMRAKYEHMKRSHMDMVSKQLDMIWGKNTGRTILQQFHSRPTYSVMILPFVCDDHKSDAVARTVPTEIYAATAKGERMYDKDGKDWDCHEKFDGTKVCRGTGTGSSVDIFYPQANPLGLSYSTDETDDEILLHELVHALRTVSGVRHRKHVLGGYRNQEEFLAVLVANMYRSEKHRGLMDYDEDPISAKRFLHTVFLNPTEIIRRLRDENPALFAALLGVKAPFNPVKQYFDEL
jgi:hypothetical protein